MVMSYQVFFLFFFLPKKNVLDFPLQCFHSNLLYVFFYISCTLYLSFLATNSCIIELKYILSKNKKYMNKYYTKKFGLMIVFIIFQINIFKIYLFRINHIYTFSFFFERYIRLVLFYVYCNAHFRLINYLIEFRRLYYIYIIYV